MENEVLQLQELPETDERELEPMMCCDTDHTSGQCTDPPRCRPS
ncbi:hypothetical protein QZH56_33860 [Streptomyces olivoreticuli]|nr:hypothetical protein [Streptomyces olivoreticuli]WKK23637.1 hypothetical protein QZH56_33860 [Streptomyces olivoreticuli]